MTTKKSKTSHARRLKTVLVQWEALVRDIVREELRSALGPAKEREGRGKASRKLPVQKLAKQFDRSEKNRKAKSLDRAKEARRVIEFAENLKKEEARRKYVDRLGNSAMVD